MNNKQIITIIAAILVAAALLAGLYWYANLRRPVTIQPPGALNSSCLKVQELAAHEKENGRSVIIVRDKETNRELRRVDLPESVLSVQELQQCGVYVVQASGSRPCAKWCYDGTQAELEPGGTLDRWQYSYDGKGAKKLNIISGPNTRFSISPSGKYVATWNVADVIYNDRALSAETGEQLTPSISDGVLQFGVSAVGPRFSWTSRENKEVLWIEFEDGRTGSKMAAYFVPDTRTFDLPTGMSQ
jgi:hypothetical protein